MRLSFSFLKINSLKQLPFKKDDSGMAATEFALLLPVMTILFFGMLEGSDLLTVNRKLETAANSLADLVTQETRISHAELSDTIIGVTNILKPVDTSAVTINVVSVSKGPNQADPILVDWSRDNAGDTPYTPGAQYTSLKDDASVNANVSIIVVEISFSYTPGYVGQVFTTPFDFEHHAKRWPRKSTRVQLCRTSSQATCTS